MKTTTILILCLAGCTALPAEVSPLTDDDRAAFAADLDRLTATTEASTEAEHAQVVLLTSIRDEVAQINESRKEVIAVSVDENTESGDDQSKSPIGSAVTVDDSPDSDLPVLHVTYAGFNCPPCDRLKAAIEDGLFNAFRVVEAPDFDGNRGYPAIRWDEDGLWKQINGYDSQTIRFLSTRLLPVAAAPAHVSPRELAAINHLHSVHGIDGSGMNLQQLEAAHDAAHGGSGYHFPGYASLPLPVRLINRGTSCPTGNCPTSRRGLFGRQRR